MGRRSRRRDPSETGGSAGASAGSTRDAPAVAGTPRGHARGEERDAAARDALEPLAPGERPGAITVAAIVSFALAVGNLVFLAADVELRGQETSPGGAILFAGLMLAAAAGLWRARYWAVLGFQALLGLALLYAAVSLAFVNNLAGVAICLAILAGAGWLFWKLVRAMARIQMPERPGARR